MPPIHVRYQQRTGRKGFTLIEGIPDDIDMKKLLKAFKKKFACNGTIVDNPEKGLIIQLQGENRQNVKAFLIYEGIGTEDTVKVHGHWTLILYKLTQTQSTVFGLVVIVVVRFMWNETDSSFF